MRSAVADLVHTLQVSAWRRLTTHGVPPFWKRAEPSTSAPDAQRVLRRTSPRWAPPPAWSGRGPAAARSAADGVIEGWSADHRPRTRLKMKSARATMTRITRMVHNMVRLRSLLVSSEEIRGPGAASHPNPVADAPRLLPPVPRHHQCHPLRVGRRRSGDLLWADSDRCVQRLVDGVESAEHVTRPAQVQEPEHGPRLRDQSHGAARPERFSLTPSRVVAQLRWAREDLSRQPAGTSCQTPRRTRSPAPDRTPGDRQDPSR
jgi:hypothetical protein